MGHLGWGWNECHGQGDRWAWAGVPRLPALESMGGCGAWPVELAPVPELLCRPPVWAGGLDARDFDLGSFLLVHFSAQLLLPRGEGNGRAEEVGLARPPVQPGLGTLPKAPETMPGMEAGLARGGPGEGQKQSPIHSQYWLRPGGPQHPPLRSWAPCPIPGFCPPTPWHCQPCHPSRRSLFYPAPILTP